MIDCSTNILQIIREHPEQVRTALGIGNGDNYIILQPISGIYEDQDCIFIDNRVDDYVGYIYAYIIIGIGYEPDMPALIDGSDMIVESNLLIINQENNIYGCQIKNYSCDINSGLFVRTRRKRFWVNAYVCEEGNNLGYVEGGRFVEYGNPVTLRAIPNESDYTVTWTDTSDPESPVVIDSNALTHTINNITRNYYIETCFIAPPKTHTFRLFTNDGKISNLDLNKMVDGYKLGDISVSFILNGTTYTLDTTRCGYGQIKTFDFRTGDENWINFNSNTEHSLDRGIILYNVPEDISFQLTSITYDGTCCYTNECEETIQYTSFKGWITESNNVYDYNTLHSCELHYPTYEWIEYTSGTPGVNETFIETKESLPETAVCCDSYFIEVPDGETPSTSTYYYRNTNPNDDDITLNVSDCYGVLDPSETTITIQSLVDDVDYFAIYEPMSSNIVFKNSSGTDKTTIGVNDYCECCRYKYMQIPESVAVAHNPQGIPSIPDPNDDNSPEYIVYGNIYYRKIQYRETGAYYNIGDKSATVKEMRGTRINVSSNAYTNEFPSEYYWDVFLNGYPITGDFNGESFYNTLEYHESDEFAFNVCGDGLNIILYKHQYQ